MYVKWSQDQGTCDENYTAKILLHISKSTLPYHLSGSSTNNMTTLS